MEKIIFHITPPTPPQPAFSHGVDFSHLSPHSTSMENSLGEVRGENGENFEFPHSSPHPLPHGKAHWLGWGETMGKTSN